MMSSKENMGKGNTIRSSDVLALLQQKRQQTILRREASRTTSPATRATSSSIPKRAGKHSRQSEQTILRRPPTPTTALRTPCLGDSPNDNGDDVDITSQPLSPTIPTTSSTKRPLTARNGNISEGARTRSRQTEPTLLRRLPKPTTGLRTPCLGDSPNCNGDNVDVTSQPLSPTIPTASSTKRPLTARNGNISEGAQTHSRQSEPTFLRRLPTPTTGLRTPCLGDSPNDNGDNVDITSQPLSPTIPTTSSTKRPLTSRNENISEVAQARSRQTEPTLLRRLPTPNTGLRTPSLGDSPNDNGDNVDITSQPLSPTISTSSTKPPLTARGRHFIPRDKRPINVIGQVIKKKFDGVWPRYSHVPSDVRKKWWGDFKSHWYISKEDKHLVRSLFEKKTGERLRDMLYEARKCYRATRKIPEWIPVTVFEKMLDFWKTEKYIRSSDANSSNRRQNSVGGLPVGTYNSVGVPDHSTIIK